METDKPAEGKKRGLYLRSCPSGLENSQNSIKGENLDCHGTRSLKGPTSLFHYLPPACMDFPLPLAASHSGLSLLNILPKGSKRNQLKSCDVQSIPSETIKPGSRSFFN